MIAPDAADLVIRPRAEGIGRLEFHQLDAAREAGRLAAREALERAPAFLTATSPVKIAAQPAPVGSSTPAAAAPQKRQAHPCPGRRQIGEPTGRGPDQPARSEQTGQIMVALFSRPGTKAGIPQRSMPETGEQALMLSTPGQAGRVQNRPSAQQAAWSAGGPLRCLWYRAELADTVAVVDEFLRTPAAAAALADFCQARRGSHAAPLEAHALAGAVALVAVGMCP